MPYLMVLYTGEMKNAQVSTLQKSFTGAALWLSAEWQITFLYRLLNYDKNLQMKDLYRPLLPTAKTLCLVGLHLKHDSTSSLSPEHDIKLYLNSERIECICIH